jgi:seryl-tRNA synthetase
MIEPVEIINRFTEYSPSKGEEPLPLPIPGHWFRKICALAERIARAENERDTLRARITELEADRDSESRWAKEYLARAEKADAMLASVLQMSSEINDHHDNFVAGREAGMKDRLNKITQDNNPYPVGTDHRDGWNRGWSEMDNHLRAEASEADAERLAEALKFVEFGDSGGVDGPGYCPACGGRGAHAGPDCVCCVRDALKKHDTTTGGQP